MRSRGGFKGAALPLALAGILAAAQNASAETMYVIEQLVVGVTTTPESESERVTTIRSGDKAEVLERQGDYARIQLPSGEEGWVRTSYLSTDLPLQQRLNARMQETEQLRKEMRKLQAELAEARVAAAAPPPAPAPAATVAEPPVTAQPDTAPVDEPSLMHERTGPRRPVWQWVIGSSAIALLMGFALGWRVLDRRIRAKYGGLRIY